MNDTKSSFRRVKYLSSLGRVAVLLVALGWYSLTFAGEIHDAAQDGDLEKIKVLLKDNPALVNSKDNDGWTPLHLAAMNGYTNLAQLLLNEKADVNAKTLKGRTPLQVAVLAGHKEMAELLRQHGAQDAEASSTIHNAAAGGDSATPTLLPDALDASSQSKRIVSRSDLARLREDESVCWGFLDECDFYGVTEAAEGSGQKSARDDAAASGRPIWTCTGRASVLLGKIDFMMTPKDKLVRLSFANEKTGQRFETLLLPGVSAGSPFYIVLPRGKYQLKVNTTWEKYTYTAMAMSEVTSPGGRSAVYIGHLHMGVQQKEPGDIHLAPDVAKMLFDTDDTDSAASWFRLMHPSFNGRISIQQIVEHPVVINQQGHVESIWSRFGDVSTAKPATNSIERLEWVAAIKSNDIDGFEKFLKQFPGSDFTEDVETRIGRLLEERDWNQALLKNNPKAFDEFWKLHPTATRFEIYRTTSPDRDGFAVGLESKKGLHFASDGTQGAGEIINLVAMSRQPNNHNVVTLLKSGIVKDGIINVPGYGAIHIRSLRSPQTPVLEFLMTDSQIAKIREILGPRSSHP